MNTSDKPLTTLVELSSDVATEGEAILPQPETGGGNNGGNSTDGASGSSAIGVSKRVTKRRLGKWITIIINLIMVYSFTEFMDSDSSEAESGRVRKTGTEEQGGSSGRLTKGRRKNQWFDENKRARALRTLTNVRKYCNELIAAINRDDYMFLNEHMSTLKDECTELDVIDILSICK